MEPSAFQAAADSVAWSALGSDTVSPSWPRIVGSMVVVLALVVAAGAGWRRLVGARVAVAGGHVRVVSRTTLARRSELLVVEVDGRRVLVGATAHQISALSEWEHEEPAIQIAEAREPVSTRFEGVLGRVMSKLGALESPS